MKQLIAFGCFVLLHLLVFSQNKPGVKKDTDIDKYKLSGNQLVAWNSLDSIIQENVFSSCLKENHVAVSVAGCKSAYLELRLKINRKGRLKAYQRMGGEICGKDLPTVIEKCLLDFLHFLEFPEALRKKTFDIRIECKV